MEHSRRMFVKSGAGIIALGTLAGCTEDAGNGNGDGNGTDNENENDNGTDPEPAADSAVVTILAESLGGDHDHDDGHDDDHDDDHNDHDDGHDDDHDDDHNDHDDGHDDDHDDDHNDHDDHVMVSQAAIDEACGHMEFDEPEAINGGASADSASVIDATHQPFDVTVENGSAYVSFDADAYGGHDDEHDDDHEEDHDDHDDGHDDDHEEDHDEEHDDDHDEEHDDHDDDHDDHEGAELFGFFARDGTVTVHEGELHEDGHDVECSVIDTYVAVEPDHGVVTLELTPSE